MLEPGEIVTLSNREEYAVVSSIEYEGKNYVYLMNLEDYKNFKFCEFKDESLYVVQDSELIKKLIIKFNTDLKHNIGNIIKDNN